MKKISKRKELMDRLIKEEVVKTVIDLIQNDRQVTMDEVALCCGVAKGTLYNYFKNKKGLLAFVHESMILPIKKSSQKFFEAPISPRKKIYAFVDNVFDFHREYPLYFKFIQSERSGAELIDERMSLAILPLIKVCQEGIQTGQFLDADPSVMANMIFGTVIGTMESLPYREAPILDMEDLKQDIIKLIDRIILKEKEK
ncbi:MAG: TetR/AcrR family transcriptional regulator [Desulfobacter sp.]|nr:TetR/AcrR family transcriptional regulator [Desulfobacter sp.]WDP84122.1 MAG: TetR/AcrR family transcriptional regulator [Desulfobacter sp.]